MGWREFRWLLGGLSVDSVYREVLRKAPKLLQDDDQIRHAISQM